MGRKPNQLILEFFERGQKLEDASNRYQHTCKACGEKFPKGRIDSLTAHLVKKCPAISLRDRQKALLQLNDLPDLPDGSRTRNGDVQMNGPTVELPIGNRNWTALETLAEVSRQIDLSEKQDDRGQNNRSGAGNRADETPRMEKFELQEQWTPDNPPLSYEARVQRDKKLLSQKLSQRNESSLSTADLMNMSSSPTTSPKISMAEATSMAAAATAAASQFTPAMVDPQLLGEGLPEEPAEGSQQAESPAKAEKLDRPEMTTEDSHDMGHEELMSQADSNALAREASEMTWSLLEGADHSMYPEPDVTPTTSEAPVKETSYSRLTVTPQMTTEFRAEYSNAMKNSRPKVRGRFSATRRKEVQEVRKRGACIRCRMLKKPCSGDNPCSTCRNVESARLWKQPCIRTRIAEELEMYSAGLHTVLAYHEVSRVKGRVKFKPSPYQIEASHYPETTVYATFNALEGQDTPLDIKIDPTLGLEGFTPEPSKIRILDNDSDDLPMKLEAYMKRISSVFFEKEPSHFMNVTLNTALELSIQKQDSLLARVLELWSTVHILVDHELRWSIFEKTSMGSEAGQGLLIDPETSEETYTLLSLQLNAAAEKKAAQISKFVLNDLERRLLQRSSTSSFETYLVALILLNCVEKSTWLFKYWEQDSFKARWPLDKTPIWYGSQGDRITDMLQMLLRMRGIPPKTHHRAGDGVLVADGDPVAHEYFEKLQISYTTLMEKQIDPMFDPADSRCYELRFCSKLLLPAG